MKRLLYVALISGMLFVVGLVAQVKPDQPPQAATVTKADLEARLTTLMQEREQALANLNAYDGAIADCKYWLGQLKSKETAPAQSPSSKPK